MSNLYKALVDLLPKAPLQVGTVIGYSDGVATIQVPGGGITQARGEAAVDDLVFFRDNVIEGPAPDLTLEIIEV
jgi:hypothetical protein